MSEIRDHGLRMTDHGLRTTDYGLWIGEVWRQRTEGREQRSEVGGQKSEVRAVRIGLSSVVRSLLSLSSLLSVVCCLWSLFPALAADPGIVYQNDFSKGEVGKLPEEMLVLD